MVGEIPSGNWRQQQPTGRLHGTLLQSERYPVGIGDEVIDVVYDQEMHKSERYPVGIGDLAGQLGNQWPLRRRDTQWELATLKLILLPCALLSSERYPVGIGDE